MRLKRRSEKSCWIHRAWSLGVVGALAFAAGGCRGFDPDDLDLVDMDQVADPHNFKYNTQDLTPQALEERMKEADLYFVEPRSFGKVLASYETCLKSISERNGYAALWRGARACAWIAINDDSKSRRIEYATKGIKIGREATRRSGSDVTPEAHYYYALSLGALAESSGDPSRGFLEHMRDEMKIALSLDEKIDYCGPHRFLGDLYVKSSDYPLYSMGSTEEGLRHLKRAAELCPDYGENHLAYATALASEGEVEPARVELEKVMASPKLKDRSAEHDAWLTKATALMADLQGK